MRRSLVALLVAVAVWAALFSGVLAHAEPASIKPGDGAVLARAPGQVEIVMTQEMARQAGANDIEVLDASGQKVTRTAAVIDNADRRRLTVALPADLAVGAYSVKWKTLSADDGDSASGSLTFTYDPSRPASAGREQLTEGAAAPATAPPEPASGATSLPGSASDDGMSWVLVVAVGIGMFVVGSGTTFLVVQKKP